MDTNQFTAFYRFVFFLCRDTGKRNIQISAAVKAWQLLLKGRFRLLDKWCMFVTQSGRAIMTEDTWLQVLDFSRTVHEDLGNYDINSAWPVLLDEFVEFLRARHTSSKPSEAQEGPSYLDPTGQGSGLMGPMSHRCGNKRRVVDVDHVTAQLQHMPLVSQPAPSSPSHPGRNMKRLCCRRQQQHGASSSQHPASSSLSHDSDTMSPMSEGYSPMASWGSGQGFEPQRLSAVHQILQQTVNEALDLG